MDILDCLQTDHDALRSLMVDLDLCEMGFDEKRSIFRALSSLAESTLKAQEGVVLSWARTEENCRPAALELLNKIELADYSLRSVRMTANQEAWEAGSRVYRELLFLYFAEMEKEIFAGLHEFMTDSERREMGARYLSYRKHSQDKHALNFGSLSRNTKSTRQERLGGRMKIASRIVSGATLAVMTLALGTGCSTFGGDRDDSPASPVAADAAKANNASQVAEISFDKGSAALTDSARESLVNMINATRTSGREIDDVRVAAWADAEYPSDRQAKLSKDEQELADKRATAIRDFLKSNLNVDDIDTYNMATQPGTFARAFNTEDVRVKEAFKNAGMPNSESGTTLSAKASRAVVMVITE